MKKIFHLFLAILTFIPGLVCGNGMSMPSGIPAGSSFTDQQAERLIWIKIDLQKDRGFLPEITGLLDQKEIGGIIFTGTDLPSFVQVRNELRACRHHDFLMALDGEGSPAHPPGLPGDFPSNEVIAAIGDSLLQKEMIATLCDQLKAAGLQVSISGFIGRETNAVMKKDFADHQILLAIPGDAENLVPSLIKPGNVSTDVVVPRLFTISSDLPDRIDSFLENIEKKCRDYSGNKKFIRTYNGKIGQAIHLTKELYPGQARSAGELKSLLNSAEDRIMAHEAFRYSSVLLKNEDQIIPVSHLGGKRIALISFTPDQEKDRSFRKILGKYTQIDYFSFPIPGNNDAISSARKTLKNYNLFIFSLFPDQATCQEVYKIIDRLSSGTQSIVCTFGIPPTSFPDRAKALLVSLGADSLSQSTAAQVVFGGIPARAKLPFAVAGYLKGSGLSTGKSIRFEYTIPEMAGIDGDYLSKAIDSVATMAIREQAFPGCQVLIAKDRKIVYHHSFGYHTYYKKEKVKNDDIYDLASVTKVTGTLPAIMQFVDQKKIDLDEKFSVYWPDFRNTNKKDLRVREILAHQSGLQSWIPYWRSTVDSSGNFLPGIFRAEPNDTFCIQVTRHLFLNRNYRKVMFRQIRESPVSSEKKYVYSGLPFYIFPEIIKNITHQEYPAYITNTFYHPLGAWNITFNAWKFFPLERIVPTEFDDYFRFSLLHGFVDDEGAAMMGGISGNAGLFSDANDLAKLMQMYLQMGEYGGERFISEKTMREFTSYQYPENGNRRGLVFDKPEPGNDTLSIEKCYPAYSASSSSFGHSGYTGTFVWCDPEYQLVYIFLSNRVYPTRKNTKIGDMHVRMIIHQEIYDAIERFKIKERLSDHGPTSL